MQTIPTDIGTMSEHGLLARCGKRSKAKTAISTCPDLADGFLTHQFLPLWEQGDTTEFELPPRETMESGFFKSLSLLCAEQGIEPLEVADKGYPYNILLAHWDAARQLERQNALCELVIIADEQHAALAARETYPTGSTLYHIPMFALYKLLQDKAQKSSAELLLSVCSYLYHIVGIPYYRDNETHMYWQYEMMAEWLMDDPEGMGEADFRFKKSQLDRAAHVGDVMQRKIHSPWHLEQFQKRIADYHPKDGFGQQCLNIAATAFELMQAFPQSSVFSHMDSGCGDDETICASEYISFVADNEGSLYDEIVQMLNDDFGNKSCTEEPVALRSYHTSQENRESIEFEKRLFPMLVDLCYLLNEIR